MKTTFLTVLRSVFNDRDSSILNRQLVALYNLNKQSISYDDMLDIAQNTLLYNLRNGREIKPANFIWKFRNLLSDTLKHRGIITMISLGDITENEILKK
jgi:hypothetical protein